MSSTFVRTGALVLVGLTLCATDARAVKEKFDRSKPHVSVATLDPLTDGLILMRATAATWESDGHRVQPASYAQIDNAPEEKERGITINTSHVEYETATRHYEHFDGGDGTIRNMVTGVAQMDGAIIVVDAPDGPTPQTREHVLLARQVGVPSLVVFLDGVHLVASPAELDLVEEAVRALLTAEGFDGTATPIIRGSALGALNGDPTWQDSIRDLVAALDAWVPIPPRDRDKPFLMPVEDAFSIASGTVATGRIETGVVAAGDDVEIVGLGGSGVFTVDEVTGALESREGPGHGEPTNASVAARDVHRGMVIAKPGTITPHARFRAIVVPTTKAGTHGVVPLVGAYVFDVRTASVDGTASAGPGVPAAGDAGPRVLLIDLAEAVALSVGTPLSMREGGHTVGAGQVTEILD